MEKIITYEDVKASPEIATYIRRGDEVLEIIGFTEHSFAHAGRTAETAATILQTLKYDERTIDLARIAAWMHDIGNVVNRKDHAQSGAVMAFRILDNMGLPAEELATVVGAIGQHDEGTGNAISPVSAALILSDKTDVRRTRVRNPNIADFDIHDRVNYAVVDSSMEIGAKTLILHLKIDTNICALMDYFEIFLQRMLMCRRAANYLDMNFGLEINGSHFL
jgi:metal-dependent HD superfamily phosphatase/phosphodiesterase